jgi:myxalamid-type nonribosomal peptide synthetase MxaA
MAVKTLIEQYRPRMLDPDSVMLTGATGYVGAFLLEALIRHTRADVHTLVRAATPEEGMERIRGALEAYRVWDDAFTARIRPVVGDLSKPLLGLRPERFAELAGTLDAIYHNGALVNFAYPYSLLRGPNVQGTQEVVRLSCQGRPKALHYMGTIDSFVATHVPRPWREVDPPEEPRRDAPDGYMLSKWVAERLVIGARDRGVPVTIFRPTWVIGHTTTGASAPHNFLLLQLKCYLELGVLPKIPLSEPYNGVPIDYLAHAVVHLSRQEGSLGKTFHPWSPVQVDFDEIYQWIAEYGYDFDVLPRRQVVERLKQLDSSASIYPLVPLLERMWMGPEEPHEPTPYDPEVECANAWSGLAGSGIDCPPTSRELMHTCLSYMIELGFFPAPGKQVASRRPAMSHAR